MESTSTNKQWRRGSSSNRGHKSFFFQGFIWVPLYGFWSQHSLQVYIISNLKDIKNNWTKKTKLEVDLNVPIYSIGLLDNF